MPDRKQPIESNTVPEFEVDLENVTFTYEDGTDALIDISLQARMGECVVILGANGAGKSTFCFLLSGIVPNIFGGQRSGKVSVAGRDPWDDPISQTAESCGVLLQDPEVQLFNPTVFTEMAFGPSNLQVPREEILTRIEESIELLHLEGLEERSPRDLSGGQKQRVTLGSILAMRPRVLVLDEPTSQLDPIGRWEVVEAIHRLKSAGQVTIIMTTHETDDILDLADRVIVLNQGRIALQGTPAEVFSQTEILESTGVKIPTSLNILTSVAQIADQPASLTDELLKNIDAKMVASEIQSIIQQGRIEVRGESRVDEKTTPKGDTYLLEAIDLTFQYPGYPPVVALNDVNLGIRAGEIVGIIGQNGSGKSTLAECFVGLLRPTHGRILYNGEDICNVSVGGLARKVGLVLQNPDYQLFTSSNREEILFGLNNIGVSGEEAEAKIHEVLRWVDLEEMLDVFPFRMSFGDRRKLAVAATVALDPKVLILDEPTTAQDHRGRYQLAEIGLKFREENNGPVLMITHDMDLIARYAERLIVMWNSRIFLDGPTAEVFAQVDELKKTFLHPPVVAEVARELEPLGVPGDLLVFNDLLATLNRRQ